MSDIPVTLGGLELTGIEVPSFYDHLGTVRTAMHHLIGGGRVIQTLGVNPGRRQLNGCFIGPDATQRALVLESLRDEQLPVVLTIGAWSEIVIVTAVVVRYAEKGSVIPFIAVAEAVVDSLASSTLTQGAIASGIVEDLAAISAIATSTNILGDVSPLLQAATGSLSNLTGSIDTAQIASASSDLAPISTHLANVVVGSGSAIAAVVARSGASGLVGSAADLNTATSSAGTLASATRAGGYMNRVAVSAARTTARRTPVSIHS